MKMWMIVFLLLPVIGAAYVSWRIWQILPLVGWCKSGAVVLFLLGLSLMIFNLRHGLDNIPLGLARCMYDVGYSWVFVLLYLFMIFLVLDLGRLIHLVPKTWLVNSTWGSVGVALLTIAIFVGGNLHYKNKVRVPLTLTSEKPLTKEKKIVMLSDLHLGYHNPRAELARWVEMINAEHADMVLIAGDVIDISVRPLYEERMAEEFHRLNAPVYACYGNHEYYSDKAKAQQFYTDAGIHILQDEVAELDDINIIGRDDRTNMRRQSIADLVQRADKGKFTILLDHQPYHLEKAEQAGVDFQFSGHTHYGQVWPISWITRLVYECSYGSHQRGKTHYYVSSGIGIWGGKYRIGTQSEYVVLTLTDHS